MIFISAMCRDIGMMLYMFLNLGISKLIRLKRRRLRRNWRYMDKFLDTRTSIYIYTYTHTYRAEMVHTPQSGRSSILLHNMHMNCQLFGMGPHHMHTPCGTIRCPYVCTLTSWILQSPTLQRPKSKPVALRRVVMLVLL